MKSFLGITIFVLLGLLAATVVGFSNLFPSSLPYDYEQQNLNKQIVIKFSYVVSENTPKGLAAEKFANLVNEKTNGRVKVELFPDGSLYNEFDEMDALERGNVQMIAPDFSMVSNTFPKWSIMDLPFAFANDDEVHKALSGDIGQELLKTLTQKDMLGLAFWDNGFRQITSSNWPIIHPSDCEGQDFRTELSKAMESQFHELDATTTSIPFNQLYRQLETHAVDGEENSISNIYSQKLYQVQKYITINNISYLGYVVIIDKTFWDKIPSDLQGDITDAMRETTEWEKGQAVRLNQQQWDDLRKQPIKIHVMTDAEKEQWEQVLKPVYTQFTPIVGKRLMNELQSFN
jgi:tripartite ATP-independent transporter DctP family solute receptor